MLSLSAIVFSCLLHAQQRVPVSKDSVLSNKVNWLRQSLNLTDTQAATIKKDMRQLQSTLDSLGKLSLLPEVRTSQLNRLDIQFKKKMKELLTKEQWNNYESLEAQLKEHMNNRQSQRQKVAAPASTQ